MPFGEKSAITRDEATMNEYLKGLENITLRKHIRREFFSSGKNLKPLSGDLPFYFPELHVTGSFPACNDTPPDFHAEIINFLQSDIDQSVPVAPLPSISEHAQAEYDTTSRLNVAMLSNIQETKKIKQIYRKILSKQVLIFYQGSEFIPPTLPNALSFQKHWKDEDLPNFSLNSEISLAILRKSCGWILSHQGFDSIHH